MDDDIVAQNADRRVARDLAVLDVAARDRADSGDLVGLTEMCIRDSCSTAAGQSPGISGR